MNAVSEHMAHAIESYLAHGYPDRTLREIGRGQQEHDSRLAGALFNWRQAAGWPEPQTIGELRCAGCHRPMGDEPSACEDEDVCAKCGKELVAEATDV